GKRRRPKGDSRSTRSSRGPCPTRPRTTGLRPSARRWARILSTRTSGKPSRKTAKKMRVTVMSGYVLGEIGTAKSVYHPRHVLSRRAAQRGRHVHGACARAVAGPSDRAGAPCSKGSQGGKIGEQEDTDARTDCRRDRPRIVAATGAGSVPGPQRRRLPALACTAPRGDRERLDHRREERPRARAAAQSPGRRLPPAATGDLDRVAQAADEVPGARRHARRRRKGDAGRRSAAGEPLGDRQALYRAGAREPRALGACPSNRRKRGERAGER